MDPEARAVASLLVGVEVGQCWVDTHGVRWRVIGIVVPGDDYPDAEFLAADGVLGWIHRTQPAVVDDPLPEIEEPLTVYDILDGTIWLDGVDTGAVG